MFKINQKIINILDRIMKFIISSLIKFRRIPLLGVFSYFFLKIIGIEIPVTIKIGHNFQLVHWANGLVIHPNTTINDNVKIYQGVTLGRADIHKSINESNMKSIIVKEGAIICSGAKVLCKEGTLTIGRNSIIGANSVLTKSTGDNEIWAGIPAKKISNRIESKTLHH